MSCSLPQVPVLGISVIVFGGLVLGFLLGLFAFRIKARWCPRCGHSTEVLRRAVRR
ncbi:hypothetical protein GA0070618_3576 [Micromonospora echinospora]|uniref:Uncharacterized protein n=1 Tax=Micromonospora echinospora TaxID=1877 RepID=A0A1C4Y448_MICEC|nr:hypothetical protein [Micromonospora echinospora]SCF15493.1 hypothetical protein GA0070618_3576 [Micromonospora echinospora]